MALFGLQAPEVALASLTDAELIRQLWREIDHVSSERERSDLYFTATEVLERFAPEAGWTVEEEYQRESTPENFEDEMAAVRDARERRRRAREALAAFHEEDVA